MATDHKFRVKNGLLVLGANDNSAKADFALNTGGSPTVSLHGTQVQMGSSDMNWNGKISYITGSGVYLSAWDIDLRLTTNGGASASAKNIRFSPQASGGSPTERMVIEGAGPVDVKHSLKIAGTTVIDTSRNILLGTAGKLVLGSNATTHPHFKYSSPNESRHHTAHGYISFGPQNTTGAHIYTDLDRFYFNKKISLIDNKLISYDDDLQLRRLDADANRIVIGDGVTTIHTPRTVITGTGTNSTPSTDHLQLSGYGIIGNRGTVYLTNSNSSGAVQIGVGAAHNNNPKVIVSSANTRFNTPITMSGVEVIDSSRNITAGTISSGAITATGSSFFGSTSSNNDQYIRGNGNVGLRIQTNAQGTGGADGMRIGLNGVHAFVWQFEALPLAFATSGTERLSISSGGSFDFKGGNFSNVGTISSGAITSTGTLSSGAITSTGNSSVGKLGVGTSDYDTTNLALDVNGHASVRRNYHLYLGVNSNNYNSWQAALTNSGSTAEIWSQVLNHKNTGYGSTHFFQSDANGFDIKTGALRINGTTVINSNRNLTNIGTISSGAITATTVKETDGGDGFTEIGSSSFGYFSWGIEIANPNNGYRAIRFAGKKKYFVLEADVLGTNNANHTGMFWGNAEGTAILGGSTTGYKTTHQNSTSFHIRAINSNSNQETYNPGFSPSDGAWHHQKIAATPDGYVRVWIDGDLKFEETGYIPSAEGYLGFINYAGTVRFANIRCRTINEDEAQHYSQHIGNTSGPYTNDDRFIKLANNVAGKTGTLVTADNGNTWLNADGGKDLWLNWYSLNSPASKADLQVGNGAGGGAILTVDGTNNRVGINDTSPSATLDVNGTISSGAITSSGAISGTALQISSGTVINTAKQAFVTSVQHSSVISFLNGTNGTSGSGAQGINVRHVYAGTNYSSATAGAGEIEASVGFKVAGNSFINSSRNITAGTISSGAITSTGQVNTFYSGANNGSLAVGRQANQSINLFVNDGDNSIIAYQDADGNSTHNFILQRDFDGTGANNFLIRKGTSTQLQIDTNANATFYGNLYVPQFIYHGGDTNTYIQFTGDRVRIAAGGTVKFDSNNTYQTTAAPSAVSITSSSIVSETVEIVFGQSSTSGVSRYEIWSDGGGSDFSLIGKINAQDAASSMSFVDTTFTDTGTINYRVYAVRYGIYSTAATTSVSFSQPSLDVTNFSAIADLNNFYLQYEKPNTRFLDHIEIYVDTDASSSNLARSGASLIYSGDNSSYMYTISASDRNNFHQFWVECVGV